LQQGKKIRRFAAICMALNVTAVAAAVVKDYAAAAMVAF
jgi:hypothetical protein